MSEDTGREPDGNVRPALGEALALGPVRVVNCEHYWAYHVHRGMSLRLCQLCHEPDWDDLASQLAVPEEAKRIVEEAFFLRQNGERAPGGNETWHDWERKAELYLRGLL